MADNKLLPPVNPVGFLKWIIGFLAIMWVIWFFTGGPERYESKYPFIKPPSPINTGEVYGPSKQVKSGEYNNNFIEINRGIYTFEIPENWHRENIRYVDGCLWDGVANNSNDGHRMAGEIGIYEAKCFNLDNARGKKEYKKKKDFYIVSYYDESTTEQEIMETKEVFDIIVKTFKIK